MLNRSDADRQKLLAEIAQLKVDLLESQESLNALFLPPPPPPPMPTYEQLFGSSVGRSRSKEIKTASKIKVSQTGLQPNVVSELSEFFKGGRPLKKPSHFRSCEMPESEECTKEFLKQNLFRKFKSANYLQVDEDLGFWN